MSSRSETTTALDRGREPSGVSLAQSGRGFDAVPITARGVAEGDPAVLATLQKRRGGAVLAYCRHVCIPGAAPRASAEAFAAFRREVAEAPDPTALDPEQALLRATRYAAAAHAPRFLRAKRGLMRLGLGRSQRCMRVPDDLAARESGEGGGRLWRWRLARHVANCDTCKGAEARVVSAEQAYHASPDAPSP